MTYTDEQGRHRGSYSQSKEERDDLWWAPGVGPENMVNLLLLAVPHRLLVVRCRSVGIRPDLDVEDGRVVAIGRAKRADNYGSLERLRGNQKLDGDVLLGLFAAVSYVC